MSQQIQNITLGSVDFVVYRDHDYLHRKGPGPSYFVDVMDCPRQFSIKIDIEVDMDRYVGAVACDVAYPIWNRLVDFREWVHDDFGNLVSPRRPQ
jgi:hypothetical protein